MATGDSMALEPDDGAIMAQFANELAETTERPQTSQNALGAKSAELGAMGHNIRLVLGIPVTMKVILGSATLLVSDLARVEPGTVVPLDRKAGERLDIVVNGRTVAHGEMLLLDGSGSRFGIRVTDVLGAEAYICRQERT